MIYFLGDTHGKFQHVIEAVERDRPDAIVFLGDIQARQPLDVELASITEMTEVWFIHGNHDTDSDAGYTNLFESQFAGRNLHGRIAEIAGLRVAGLGGVFRGQVWMPPAHWKYESPADFIACSGSRNVWKGGLPRKHRSTIFPSDCFGLLEQQADILVTHEAPSAHPHGFGLIDELARSLSVQQAFHGHHHDRRDYRLQAQRLGFAAFGVGYRGITDQTGRVIRSGDFDGAPPMA